MIERHLYKKIRWIDLESPTKEEVLSVSKELNIPSVVSEELLSPTLRSRVDLHDKLIYLILRFPGVEGENCDLSRIDCNVEEQEIDFVIGRDFIVTTRYEKLDKGQEFSKIFKDKLDQPGFDKHAGFFFVHMARELYRLDELELESINQILKEIERKIFEGQEGEMVGYISNINRKLLDFKQAIRFHEEILKSFEDAGAIFFGEDFRYYLTTVTGEFLKLKSSLDSHRDILAELRNTNDSLLSKKTSMTMRTLTIISLVIFPLSLIAGIFGMNAVNIPIVGASHDFWIIVGIMVLATIFMFMFFKRKKWL